MMIILTVFFLAFDIGSKIIVSKIVNLNESINVIKSFFKITYVKNTGAAFSILDNNTLVVTIISLIIILGIVFYVCKNKPKSKLEKISYAMILAGALGNFFNRIFLGYVIDFLDFNIFGYNYPIFNLADVFIVIGVFLQIIIVVGDKHGNSSR